MERGKSKSDASGKLVLFGWSTAMFLLLLFSVDRIMQFNILSFEVFVGIVLFLIVILQLVILGWVLYLKNRARNSDERFMKAITKLEEHLEDATVDKE
jgi:Tfp pilus assembly protein PilO